MERQGRGGHRLEALRLLAAVSHDLRSPLAAIQAHADNLIGGVYGEISGEARRRVRQIRRISAECASLAEEILTATTPGTAAAEPCRDLRRALGDLAAPIRERAGSRGVRLLVRVPAGLALPGIPSGLLGAVVRNLVENAVKASPPGGTVLVHGRGERGRVRVEISDRGPGCPDLWERAPGVGLRLARGIVESHGGEVYARMRRGGGSTVGFVYGESLSGQEDRSEEEDPHRR
jgi:two-component system sensor histidine kinase KdpD